MRCRSIISLSALLLPALAQAQQAAQKDTVIKGATIEITQLYKPEVTRAPRPEPVPVLPPVDTTAPALQYDVPSQTLLYSYSSLPLRPLALDAIEPARSFGNYIKFGGGNLS